MSPPQNRCTFLWRSFSEVVGAGPQVSTAERKEIQLETPFGDLVRVELSILASTELYESPQPSSPNQVQYIGLGL